MVVDAGDEVDGGELGRVVAADFDLDAPPPQAASTTANTSTQSAAPQWGT